jgi:homocysteine S-methyltransferase
MTTQALPQASGELFLTDGGIETTLIFHEGIELPHFAAFLLLEQNRGALEKYYQRYLAIAGRTNAGFILESPTWRCSSDWGEKLGLDAKRIFDLNRDAIGLMHALRAAHKQAYPTSRAPVVVSGCVGPRGDGYDPGQAMTANAAEAYHWAQIAAFREARADMVTATTITNTPEAIGIARAARKAGLPVALSFTLETDGRLPTGETLQQAIEAVDAATDRTPAYYMINCAHPSHFAHVLQPGAAWSERVRGLRTNASKRSHKELNDSPDLDAGDPEQLGAEHRELRAGHPQINVLGGCCGTDHRHIESIYTACTPR